MSHSRKTKDSLGHHKEGKNSYQERSDKKRSAEDKSRNWHTLRVKREGNLPQKRRKTKKGKNKIKK